MRIEIIGDYEIRRSYPGFLIDPDTGVVYMTPNCYSMVDLHTGKTENQRKGLVPFVGEITLSNLPRTHNCDFAGNSSQIGNVVHLKRTEISNGEGDKEEDHHARGGVQGRGEAHHWSEGEGKARDYIVEMN